MDPKNRTSNNDDHKRDAATRLVRDQLDAIYSEEPRTLTPSGQAPSQRPAHQQPQHSQHHQHQSQPHTTNQPTGEGTEPWQQYHSEWQNYYQRYYEHYYVGHLHKAIENNERANLPRDEAEELDKKEEVSALRQKIVENAKKKAKTARKSRHFIPIFSAMIVVFIVAFLQYNQLIIANVQAYVSPGAIDPNNIVIDPNSNAAVSAEPRLIIPKINVDVPVIYNVGYDHDSQMSAMEKGVAHFAIPGANSVPGQLGNVVLSGHSSNDLFDPGDYKFIFAQLDKLQNGDSIYVHYSGVRYTYTVYKKEVVKPTNVGSLLGMEDKPYLTLITCTPLGTATNRLLIKAEQVAPDPGQAKPAGTATSGDSNAIMTGNGPTVLERLFGGR
jgi:sortase A